MSLYTGSVQNVISLLLLLFVIFQLFEICFILLFLYLRSLVFSFYIMCFPGFCIAFCIVSPFDLVFSYFLQVCLELQSGWNPIA